MMRPGAWPALFAGTIALILIASMTPASAHHAAAGCGTTPDIPQQTLFLHRQSLRARAARTQTRAASPQGGNLDIGDIAVIGDGNGVVERQNQFNLDHNSLTFTPTGNGGSYAYSAAAGMYDSGAAGNGTPLVALDDDDSRQVHLPFSFPFFGVVYNQVFINSDGNLTFGAGDSASTARSLGRMAAGPPRISPLFDDLDPSKTAGGVRVFSDAAKLVVSWVNVPEYSANGTGTPEMFQVTLFPDGKIQFSYNGVASDLASAVVGIAPGGLQGGTSIVDFRGDASGQYSGALAEVFSDIASIDIVAAAQQFYQTHDDAYDYLVIYNNMNIQAQGDALAYENTVRSSGGGYHVTPLDIGQQFGSGSRLHAVLNMGQLSQYPVDPSGIVPARAVSGDTPLTILAHESGHLFLAYASVSDPNNPGAFPMLGYQLAHWNFAYDSEASVMEGERIIDHGPGTSPRFLTSDTVQGYSLLDQYLMGFRPPSAVPDTFAVTNVMLNGFPLDTSQLHPQKGVAFDGSRLNVTINDLIQAQGRRTPDDTVAQRRYRFAFILVTPQAIQPSDDDLFQVDSYRQRFETFYATASSNNGVADTSLKRSVSISLSPAGGIIAGTSATASIVLQTPSSADLVFQLQTSGSFATLPSTVTIPAGKSSSNFIFSGQKPGVEEVLAVPADPAYETVAARIQVADGSILKLSVVSGGQQISNASEPLPDPVVIALSDANGLPYAGARVDATPSAGGAVTPTVVSTDSRGRASFNWTPGAAAANQLQISVHAVPSVSVSVGAGRSVPVITAVGNAASFASGLVPGSLATIFGQNLAAQTAQSSYPWPDSLGGIQLTLNGAPVPLLYVSSSQINFLVPADVSSDLVTLGISGDTVPVAVVPIQPGIFPGAILHAGTTVSAITTPVHAGDYIEIYCTGLGATKAGPGSLFSTLSIPSIFIGATPVQPVFSGLAPGYVGLYQVDVQIPAGLAAGSQAIILEAGLQHSNAVSILVQ